MNQKLIAILKLLSKKELAKLTKFVHSPFFNENKNISLFFDFIVKFAPKYHSSNLSYEKVFKVLFPKKTFDKQVMIKLSSKLFKLVEQYIIHAHVQDDSFQQNITLLRYYNKHLLTSHYDSTFRKIQKQHQQEKIRDNDYYEQAFFIEQVHASFMSKNDDRLGDVNLQEQTDAFDVYYFTNKLEQLCEMLNRAAVIHVPYNYVFLKELLGHLENSPHRQQVLINVYYHILQLLMNPEETEYYYYELKSLLHKNYKEISEEKLKSFYVYLTNSVRKVFKLADYYKELFDLYDVQLQHGILYYDDNLPHSLFKNIVTVSLALERFDWAKEFIERNKDRIIPKEYEEEVYKVNLANLFFSAKEYDKARELLQEVNCDDIYYKLTQKTLLAKTYFEIKELDLLSNFLNSFTRLIHYYKDKIAPRKIESYRYFINFLNRIVRCIYDSPQSLELFESDRALRDKETVRVLKRIDKQMGELQMFYGKKWLVGKIEELTLT